MRFVPVTTPARGFVVRVRRGSPSTHRHRSHRLRVGKLRARLQWRAGSRHRSTDRSHTCAVPRRGLHDDRRTRAVSVPERRGHRPTRVHAIRGIADQGGADRLPAMRRQDRSSGERRDCDGRSQCSGRERCHRQCERRTSYSPGERRRAWRCERRRRQRGDACGRKRRLGGHTRRGWRGWQSRTRRDEHDATSAEQSDRAQQQPRL